MVSSVEPSNDTERDYAFRYPVEEDDQPAMATLEAISRATGTDVTELAPLSRVIDPEALNGLFGQRSGDERSDGQRTGPLDGYRSSSDATPDGPVVTFEYEGCTVTVTPGRIEIDVDRRSDVDRRPNAD